MADETGVLVAKVWGSTEETAADMPGSLAADFDSLGILSARLPHPANRLMNNATKPARIKYFIFSFFPKWVDVFGGADNRRMIENLVHIRRFLRASSV